MGESPTPGLSPGQAPLSLSSAARAPKEGGSASSVDTACGGRRSRPWEAALVNTGRLSKPQCSDHGEGTCRKPCNDKVAKAACPGSRPHGTPARWGLSGESGGGCGDSGPPTHCFCQPEIPRNCQVRWLKRLKKKKEEESGGPAWGEGGGTSAGRGGPGLRPCPLGLVAPAIWGQHEVAPSAVTGGQVAAAAFQNILGGDVTPRPPEAPSGFPGQERGRVGSDQTQGGGLCSSGGRSVGIKDPAQFFGHQSFCRVRVTSAKNWWGGHRASPQGDGLL